MLESGKAASELAPADLIRQIRSLERAARPLEPGATARKRLRQSVVASSERFLRKVESLKAYIETEDKGIGLLQSPISEHGIPIEAAIQLFEHDVVRPGGHPASGGYLAYIPGGGIYPAALGDYLAAVSDKYAGVFFAGPGPVRMENMLLRWVADLLGYPEGAAGNIASGGSIANLTAIATARDAHGLKSADFPRVVVYLTGQAHHSISKALGITGLGEAQVRHIPTDERFRMRARNPGTNDRDGPQARLKAVARRGHRGHHGYGRGQIPWNPLRQSANASVAGFTSTQRTGAFFS